MADAIMGDTELGVTKQDLIAPLVQKELTFQAKLTQFFTNVSSYAVAGAKTISFPKLSSFTVVDRAEGVAGESTALTATLDELALNINAYVSWIIDAMTLKQSNIPAQLTSAKRAAAAQARYVDTQIISVIRSVCSYFVNVGADADVTYANCVTLSQKMEEAHQNVSDCVWLVSPSQKGKLMALDEFKRADVYGVGNIPTGVIGWILGAPVVVHSGLAAKELFLAHRDAIAYGFQSEAAYGEQDAIEYGVGAKKAAIDQLFGVCGLQLAQGGAASGKSPLVVGLND
jgi:hypothetical protein